MIRWLNSTFPRGIYAGPIRSAVDWSESHLSLNRHLHRGVRKRLGLSADENSPLWLSELYQLGALAVGAGFLILAASLPHPWRVVPGMLALYRPFEIVLFTTAWVFARGATALSTKRSVVGLLVNMAEVVVGFAAAYLGFGCVRGAGAALYSSLRTLVTIGPIGTLEPPQCGRCGSIIAGEIVVAYYLVVIIVASTVGALRESRGGPTRS
jgi:hypothetical protein